VWGLAGSLGRFEGFPRAIHGLARFTSQSSEGDLQRAILEALRRLNGETHRLEEVTVFPPSGHRVNFELGVADGNTFSFLDSQEAARVQGAVAVGPLPVLDFLCVACYRPPGRGGRGAPRFDYYLLRFAFQEAAVELRVFHERGPRHVSPGDLILFVERRVNEALLRNRLRPLTPEHLEAL